jgi:choline transporter-like protein 2/4/5
MGKCCGLRAVVPGDEEPSTKNPMQDGRKCRDCLWIGIFGAFWVGMIIVAVIGIGKGDPARLFYGIDYNGDACSVEGNTGKDYIFYPRLNKDLQEAASSGKSYEDFSFYGICFEKCPQSKDKFVCKYDTQVTLDTAHADDQAGMLAAQENLVDQWFDNGPCWRVFLDTDPTFFRCFDVNDVQENVTRSCVDQDGAAYDTGSPDECNTGNMDITMNAQTLTPGQCLHYDCTREISISAGGYGSCTAPGEYLPNDNCKVTRYETNSISESPTQSNPLMESMTGTAATIGMYAGDAYETAPEISLIGGLLALVLGFVVLLLFKYFAGMIVWSTLVGVVACSAALTFYCSSKAGMLEDQRIVSTIGSYGVSDASASAETEQEQGNQDSYKVLAYIMAVLTVVLLFSVCMLAKKVRTCIEVIRAASAAIRAIPVLVIWPIVPFVAIIVLMMYFCLIAAFIGSAGDLSSADVMEGASNTLSNLNADEFDAYKDAFNSTSSAMQDYSSNEIMRGMLFYHFFGLLWTNALINAISLTTVAGAVCRYYWSGMGAANPQAIQDSGAAKSMGRTPVWSSFYCAIRYHFGSMCLGALIIAVVQAIRAVLAYIDSKTKGLQKSNIVISIIMKVVQCCMWCLEKCLKFISRNAYICIAMRGDSFCYSTMRAFKLIFANMATVGIVNVVSTIILFLARVMITCTCGFFMFTVLDAPEFEFGGERQLSQPLFPVLIVLVLAYAVSTAFMNTFDLAIDTILICFCEDVEINKNGGEMFASKALQKIVGHKSATKKGGDEGGEEKTEVKTEEKTEEKAAAAPTEVAAVPASDTTVAVAEMDA